MERYRHLRGITISQMLNIRSLGAGSSGGSRMSGSISRMAGEPGEMFANSCTQYPRSEERWAPLH